MPSFSFPKQRRLLSSADYQPVFKQTRLKVAHGHFLLLATSTHSSDHLARLGLVIAKKRVRRAVDRNLIKRYAREGFRLRQQHLPALDLVLLMRAPVTPHDRGGLFEELDRLWDKLLAKTSPA